MNTAESPILVDVSRGAMVESRHRGCYAVVDRGGAVLAEGGDITRQVYARSAIKPLQALALVESGAAETFALGDGEIALACASHSGEDRHVATVRAWLARIGLSEDDLECGAHPPGHAPTYVALARAGLAPSAAHNNCSGKHTGMLSVCRHRGWPTHSYIDAAHPLQHLITANLEAMCGLSLADAPRGIDGCGLPQIGIPLHALARGFARFGAPDDLPSGRARACRRIAAAMVAEPFMVAGTDRFCTRALIAAKGKVVLKTGAEGVYLAAVPARGLGLAVKIDDGAGRAAEVAMARLMLAWGDLTGEARAQMEALAHPPVFNVAGRKIGALAPHW
jgi:L-asparaginase II